MAKAMFFRSCFHESAVRTCLLPALGLAVTLACASASSDDGVLRRFESKLVAPSGTVTVSTPALVEVESTAVVASEAADLGDHFVVNGTGSRAVVAMGGTGMLVRNDARVGDAFGRPKVTLLDRVIVSGSIFSATTATVPPSTSLSGIVVNDYEFEPAVTFSWTFEAPATSRGDLAIPPDQPPYLLPPGRNDAVSVMSRSSIVLSTGEYHFEALHVLEPQSRLTVNDSLGPVFLYVHGALTCRGLIESSVPGAEPNIIVVALGQQDIFLEAPFHGFLVAPNALIQMRRTDTPHVGSFFGKRIAADGAAVVTHRPFDRTVLFPEPEPPPGTGGGGTGGTGNVEEGWTDDVPVMAGWTDDPVPSDLGCEPGIELVKELNGVEVTSSLEFNDDPEPGGCVDYYTECEEIDGLDWNPTAPGYDELNDAPGLDEVCQGEPTKSPCGVIEETIEWDDPFGLCSTDADCLLFGKVCAKVCVAEGCSGSVDCLLPTCAEPQRRCAQVEPGCDPMPTEGPCRDVRVCAVSDYTGSSDPAEEEITGHDSNLTEEDEITLPPPEPRVMPGAYETDECAVASAMMAKVEPPPQERDLNAGNDLWGILVHPTLVQSAQVSPKFVGGDAKVDIKAEAGLSISAVVYGHERDILNVAGRIEMATCGAILTRELRLFADTFAAGPGGDSSGNIARQCDTEMDKQYDGMMALREAQYNAIDTERYSDCLGWEINWWTSGYWTQLCHDTNEAIVDLPPVEGFNGLLDCSTPNGGLQAALFWRLYYAAHVKAMAKRLALVNGLTSEMLAAGSSTTLPVLDQEHSYTAPAIRATVPIGPVPIRIEIEVAGRWGLGGEVTSEITDNPDARFRAAAVVRPRAAVNVVAFAGVGLGPARVGIAGDLRLISVQVPLETAVTVWQETYADPRLIGWPYAPVGATDVPYAFEKPFSDLPHFREFGPQYADWFAEWTLGAGAKADMLDGRIDVQARVDLGLFSKTYRRKIASWTGIPVQYAFVAESVSVDPDQILEVAPLGGSPAYGPMFELAPYVDPDHIPTYDFGRATYPWQCAPPALGKCTELT